jgi:uncharacterized protein
MKFMELYGGMVNESIFKPPLKDEMAERRRNNPLKLFKLIWDENITEFLDAVKSGADVNIRDAEGDTPLYLAVERNSPWEMIEALIEAGADINIKNAWGQTALMQACIYGRHYIVEALIEEGAGVDLQDCNGWTALIFAVWKRNLDIVKMLIRHGADINIENNAGFTATRFAKSNSDDDMIDFLEGKGGV